MSDVSPRLALPYLLPAQAQKHVTHNEALRLLDAAVQLSVEAFGQTVPPGLPEHGEAHALGAGATGAWAGHDGEIAVWSDGAWLFVRPQEGWRAWGRAEAQLRVWAGTDWAPVAPDSHLDGIGIGTGWDAVNRLSVVSAASLFSHDGTGHQVKVNKATPEDTASLLFQSGWSGRAEMGLAGNDDWSIKVSPDGSAWTEAMRVDAGTGVPDLQTGATIGGAMTFHRENVLGGVSLSGGVPTGALIEHGNNANGDYVRLADGTQICWGEVLIKPETDATTGIKQVDWIFPAAFSSSGPRTFVTHIVNTTNPEARGRVSARYLDANTADLRYYEGAGTASNVYTRAFAFGRW
ncbi:MAG: DUF2793 domain-containing protein [Paracoccaceae bacterium]